MSSMRLMQLLFCVATVVGMGSRAQTPDTTAATERWLSRFSMREPLVASSGVQRAVSSDLPSFEVSSPLPGKHLVRVSLPFAPGVLSAELGLSVHCGDRTVTPDVRILTRHPGKPASVRRAMITFPFDFDNTKPKRFMLTLAEASPAIASPLKPVEGGTQFSLGSVNVTVRDDTIALVVGNATWNAKLLAPARAESVQLKAEVVEWGQYYGWIRVLEADTAWPRILEVKIDALGVVAVQGHVQRLGAGDATAPDLGWEISGPGLSETPEHPFTTGTPCAISTQDKAFVVSFPTAPLYRRGSVSVSGNVIRYLRCTEAEHVPYQEAAWRSAGFVLGSVGHTPRNVRFDPELSIKTETAESPGGQAPNLAMWPALDELRTYTHQAQVKSALVGDDFGNVTAFAGEQPAPVFGMNRLNHCPAMFAEAWSTGDTALQDTAVQWCINMYDLSLWWADKEEFGGTRYNNALAQGDKTHADDKQYMWRQNNAVHFCTKGYDSFLYAYEETGDPRMAIALDAQIAYANKYVHADQGECRNIGDVADYMRLYRATGRTEYRDEALRLFRGLRTKLSTGDLFSQGGQPIVADSPFINDDQHGYDAPFAKPYIIGYALSGLPDLLREFPDEPKLRDVVRAVADFLAGSQDPLGGWRYPHPASAWVIIDQGIEHAMQLSRAARVLQERGESVDTLLDAIERTLQARVNAFDRTGTILQGLGAWETAAKVLKEGQTLYDLYKKASDRDPSRDYAEGTVASGGSMPDGLAYFGEVLDYYLSQRPAERLFARNAQLGAVLARMDDKRIKLTPQAKGSYLRMERPENAEIGFTLWTPEWANVPPLTYSEEELGGMALDWKRDELTGPVSYTLDRKEGVFTVSCEPHIDYVACTYTFWPKTDVDPAILPTQFAIGPCQQMKAGVFESDDADLMKRMWFMSRNGWTSLDSCAGGNARNVLYLEENPSPETTGAMAEGGWKTIQSTRPTLPLFACVSKDGSWIAASAAESCTSLCNNANASHRCLHTQASVSLRKNMPTTLRVNAYLMKGSLDDVLRRYTRDVERWRQIPSTPPQAVAEGQRFGVKAELPAARDAMIERLKFPLAWDKAGLAFPEWRQRARKEFLSHALSRSPLAPFAPHVMAVEDRGTYEARKLALNLSADSRVIGYLLVPKGKGPFPAVLALHDHGAHFSIGKEKVIRPFGESEDRLKDAEDWVGKCYGGRFFGDELAKRGYVVFATDMLFWGDRGRQEGIEYKSQEKLAANLFQQGTSWAGTILWDDLRSVEFLQSLPEVAPDHIACAGLSVGCFRTWNLAAASDIVKAGVAICWMNDSQTLTMPGNNQTTGQSAYTMIHPGLRDALDYPDVAAIACPKPMLFYNGEKDGLFPVLGVNAAYAKLRSVWEAQGVSDKLETRLWPVPHEFNAEMQEAAFLWLDRWMKP